MGAHARDTLAGKRNDFEALTPNILMHQMEAARKWKFAKRINWNNREEDLTLRKIYTDLRKYYLNDNVIDGWISEKLGALDLLNGPPEILSVKTFFKKIANSLPQK